MTPQYPERYPGSRQCSIRVLVPAHQAIHVYLLDLYLAYYNYDVTKQCVDALWIVGKFILARLFNFLDKTWIPILFSCMI